MQSNLVIVESPAKAKTIERFLGKDYKVMSSYGHIRDLKKKGLGVDETTLAPDYEVPDDKTKVVRDLKKAAKEASAVWLASDEDREGEAISWHLCEVLGLDEQKTKRIVFHEITKSAILAAIENPRTLNMDLVNAQQARRVLDRIVGFRLSPILWRKVKPQLSAGRVQSVAVRLIVEREREISAFKSERFYRVTATFVPKGGARKTEVRAELNSRFKTEAEAMAFLEACKGMTFSIETVTKKPVKRSPAPPFTTSTLQQEAARKLGFSVSQTMMLAQRLYESGHITYMRTDSVNLSSLCINTSKEEITGSYGGQYSHPRQFRTKTKGAQEAHEAIRPTYMNRQEVEGTAQERRLYELIWKRTIASQMAEAEIEKTTLSIQAGDHQFTATGEVITFDGYLKVYRESHDDDNNSEAAALPEMSEGQPLTLASALATERFTSSPQRYTEAALVHKLEELGIGRPSTYAPTISTIQQRGYVTKGDKKGESRQYTLLTLQSGSITRSIQTETAGSEKGKLLPTDIGIVVNDFLLEFFPDIMDYNFTATVEREFDDIAEGKKEWTEMLHAFYDNFEPIVEKTSNARAEHKVGERELGTDPKSGKPVFAKIGRFGPVVQLGLAGEKEKPRFAQIRSGMSLESITLEEALELFKMPRQLGAYEGADVSVGIGRFGPYVLHDKKYYSIPADDDPYTISLTRAIEIIEKRKDQDRNKLIKTIESTPPIEVLNGRYGPYIACDGTNYRLPKAMREKAAELTEEECREIIRGAAEGKDTTKSKGRARPTRRKKTAE